MFSQTLVLDDFSGIFSKPWFPTMFLAYFKTVVPDGVSVVCSNTLVPDGVPSMFYKTLIPDGVSGMFPRHWFPTIFLACLQNPGSRGCFWHVSQTLVPDSVAGMF